MNSDSLVRIGVMHTCSVTITSVLYISFIDTLPTDGDTPSTDFIGQYCSGIYMCVVQFGPCCQVWRLNTLGTA